jgi:hypothetical protein
LFSFWLDCHLHFFVVDGTPIFVCLHISYSWVKIRQGEEGGGRLEGELSLASVGSQTGGDNGKRAPSTQRRVGPKAKAEGRRELTLVRALHF